MKNTLSLLLRGLTAGCLMAIGLGTAAYASPDADDVMNELGGSPLRIMNNNSGYDRTHTINYRTDVDMFTFTAIPGASYTFTVEEGTVDDLDICLRAGNGRYIIDRVNTAGTRNSGNFTWNNPNIGGMFYLDVRSLGEDATGTYRMKMDVTLPTDNDNDQLPDSWETNPAWVNGPLNTNPSSGASAPSGTNSDFDSDGFTNYQELLMGTDPTTAASGLIIQDIIKNPIKAEVKWPAIEFGSYKVVWIDRRSDIASWQIDANWTLIDDFTYTGPTGSVWTENADGVPPEYKIYRVVQFGIPPNPNDPQ